jgi:hypothetical protein
MIRPTIFLYTSYRTGGTGFASAFNADPNNMIFIDPLNAQLSTFESARNANSDNWLSNHPTNLKYFENFLPLFEQGKMDQFPDLLEFKFRNSSIEFKAQLIQYVRMLSESAYQQGKLPVLKLEQLEGHVNLLRENFPEALHVGLVRNPNDQFLSWIEQLALGNSWFFDNALRMINADAEFFKPSLGLTRSTPKDIFETFHSRLVTLRPELDFTHNIYEESFEDLFKKITSNFYREKFIFAAKEFKKLEPRIKFEKKFIRMLDRAQELTQQRDELTQQRDELTQQRDELTQQRDELLNSTIWKAIEPLRRLINFIKK